MGHVRRWTTAVLASVLLLAAPHVVRGHPPDEPMDPDVRSWYRSLQQPSTGAGCCSVADCRPFTSRILRDHYEVYIHDRWHPVPNTAVLHEPNRVGSAIACLKTNWNYDFGPAPADYSPGIICFLPASEV